MLSANDFINTNLQKLNDYLEEVETANGIGKYERLAVDRFHSLKSRYDYRPDQLVKALRFFSLLHVQNQDGIDQIQLLGFQVFWLQSILCFYYHGTDNRVVDTAFLLISKKNGKSTWTGCFMLYMLLVDQKIETDPHQIILASDSKQAKNTSDLIKKTILNSPALAGLFKINRNVIKYQTDKNIAQIEILSPKHAGSLQGRNLSGYACDEYAFSKSSESADKMKSSTIARKNPIGILATTASNNLSTSPAFELLEVCRNIAEAKIQNDKLFFAIYQLDDPETEAGKPETYRKANPALGKTVSIDFLKSELAETKILPKKYQTFLTDHLNCFTDSNALETVWLEDRYVTAMMRDDKKIPKNVGAQIVVGMDLASTRDTASISWLWKDPISGEFIAETITILPSVNRTTIRNGGFDLSPYIGTFDEVIEGTKSIIQSGKESLDEDLVIDILLYLNRTYSVQSCAFDTWNSQVIAMKLSSMGVQMNPLKMEIRVLNYPMRFFEQQILSGNAFHRKDPVVRYQFSNCILFFDISGNMKPDKKRSKDSIDNVISMLCCFAEWIAHNENSMNYFIDSLKKVG